MTIEAMVEPRQQVAHVHRVGYANRAIRKKRCKRTKKHAPTVVMAVQDLYLSCREVFKGPGTVPLPQDVKRLCHIIDVSIQSLQVFYHVINASAAKHPRGQLFSTDDINHDNMKPEDFGLSSGLPFFKPKGAVKVTPKVSYTTIYQCDNFSLCIFFLPASAVIPMHNHPGMTVFSKLLLGTMHIKSYDLVGPPSADEPNSATQLRLAKLEADSVFTAPCNTSVLYPTTGGNIHQFTAITPCAVLDVLGPPYSSEDGRDCSYYKEFPYTSFSNGEMGLKKEEGDCYAWLEEIEVPENPQMERIEYLGPQVDESSF